MKIIKKHSEIKEFKGEYIWLVISEGWCGDAAQLCHYK
jgi:hypothetical protein